MKTIWWATVLLVMVAGQAVRAAEEAVGGVKVEGKKKTLAVLPFVGGDEKEKKMAERMRFAVSQKLSNDADGGGRFERMDNVRVEQVISGLQIPWGATGGAMPEEEDVAKVLVALDVDETVGGMVKGRRLTLVLYEGGKEARRAEVEIPSDKESPKLAVEKVLGDLLGAKFAHLRDVEADHSNAAVEARFAARPSLVTDGGFEEGLKDGKAGAWDVILGADHYSPPVISADAAKGLAEDRVAVVPRSVAGDAKDAGGGDGHCLMMRMSEKVAANNGLACVSTWIQVESGKKYRFTCKYFSKGPVTHVFLKGFGVKGDQYGDKNNVEAVRREFYRAQVAPTKANRGFELMEMDFTPQALKATDPKIEWVRVDLYVYLKAGDIFFDDVVVKKLDE